MIFMTQKALDAVIDARVGHALKCAIAKHEGTKPHEKRPDPAPEQKYVIKTYKTSGKPSRFEIAKYVAGSADAMWGYTSWTVITTPFEPEPLPETPAEVSHPMTLEALLTALITNLGVEISIVPATKATITAKCKRK